MKILKKHRAFDGEVRFCEHESQSTQTKMRFATFTPGANSLGGKKPAGILIWLSGLTCTEENFMAKAGAFRALSEANLMVICPDTSPRGLSLPHESDSWDFGRGASFYVDATTPGYRDHYRMATYVTLELPSLIDREFGLGNKISIFGHSMGGHGALVLGLTNPNVFKSISAFAPIANPVNCAWGEKAFAGYLGNDRSVWANYDASCLIERGHSHGHAILVDQGLNDEFLEKQLRPENLEAAAANTIGESKPSKLTLSIRFHEGYDHSYYFISSFIEDHIRHHAQALSK